MEENKDENRRVCIEVYMSAYSRDKLKAAATKMNVSLSSLVKIAINEYKDAHKSRFEVPPVIRPEVIKTSEPDINIGINKLTEEVNKLYREL